MIDRTGHQIGNYRLQRLLGRGGFADIYLGEHVYLKSLAALKILRMSLSEEERTAFLKEAQTLIQLVHPNIVRILDFAVDNDQPYLVMDYAPNGSLRERYPSGSRLPLSSIIPYVAQVASALQFAHDKGFVHRDVKPENMLLGSHSEVLLSDFGISVFASRTEPQYTTNHIAHSVAGTSRYMAPEQLQGHPQPASDQYALGVVVYEWLCGTSPYHGTLIEVAMQHLTMPPPSLRKLLPELPTTIDEVVVRALAKEPEQRFAHVQHFAEALQKAALAYSTPLTFPAPVEEPIVAQNVLRTKPIWKVPANFTSFIGREKDIAAIEDMLLRQELRLLTLAGSGGIGKTRLALQIATHMRSSFSDGVCFVGLVSTFDPTLIPSVIAETLNIQQIDSLSIFEQIKVFLHDKTFLLILDNFEQLVSAAPLIEELLAACPALKVLVTSRIVLRLRAEYEYQVLPLTLPNLESSPSETGIGQSTAVTLFVQRARMVNPNFQLTQTNARAIAEICMQLDGLPLAIELAAARSRLLPPQALLSRLSKRFEVLTGGAVTLPQHQQTLHNTLKWSYDLLDANEQQLFRRLAVFERGWTLEAAETLGNTNREGQNDTSILDILGSLIDKSLLRQIELEGTEPRFLMLMTVREYGLECLRESGEEDLIRLAHANYYLALVEEAEPHLKDAQQLQWLRKLDRDQENLRAALSWLIAHEKGEMALRFCAALWWFWQMRGYWSEGRRWLKTVLSLPEAGERTVLRAKVLSATGGLAADQGDLQEARLFLNESVTLCQELNDDYGLVRPLSTMGLVMVIQGEHAEAISLLKECITLSRKSSRVWELSRSLITLGYVIWLEGDLQQAIALTQESLAFARELGDKAQIAHALNNLGHFFWNKGDLVRARADAEEGVMLLRETGAKYLLFSALGTLGSILLSQGDFEHAKALYTEGALLGKELGNETVIAWQLIGLAKVAIANDQFSYATRLHGAAEARFDVNKALSPKDLKDYKQVVESLRDRLGKQAFATAWDEGYSMNVEQLLEAPDLEGIQDTALAESHTTSIANAPSESSYDQHLTLREREVLRLVAKGWTDAQIAQELVISRRTVNAHLTSIYRKIDVSSRSAATRYAIDRNLV